MIADIRSSYAGTAVGASESIFAMLAPALGLDLVTPPGFLRAVSEGTDPTAADKATIDEQIATHASRSTSTTARTPRPTCRPRSSAARAAGIPVTTITETMVPADGTWQHWQTAQLLRLRAALATAAGR